MQILELQKLYLDSGANAHVVLHLVNNVSARFASFSPDSDDDDDDNDDDDYSLTMMMMIMKPHLKAKKLVPYCTAHNNTNVRELPPFLGLDLTVSFQNKFPAGEYLGFHVKGVGEEIKADGGSAFGVSQQQKSQTTYVIKFFPRILYFSNSMVLIHCLVA